MRIVWLGMFVNDTFKELFKRPDMDNWGVWITHLCTLFEHESEVELHVVSPNFYTNESISIQQGSISYHFYKYQFDVPKVTSFMSANPMNLAMVSDEVKRILKNIEPDLIHVHGCDNPSYSAPALELNKFYPSIFTVQRFNFMASGTSVLHHFVVKLEEMVIRQFKHFGVRTAEMEQIIRDRNPNAKQYFHNYPVSWPDSIKTGEEDSETYDAVFFARVTRDKGIFDVIEAAKLLVKQRPEYRVKVYGPISKSEEPHILHAVQEARLEHVILFMGNDENQKSLHHSVSKARICVLPTYADIVPGTIIESMLMKLPVVTYAVGGTTEFNNNGNKRIQPVELGDYKSLADAQLELLTQPAYRRELADEAYKFATEYYASSKVVSDLKKMYREVLLNTHQL